MMLRAEAVRGEGSGPRPRCVLGPLITVHCVLRLQASPRPVSPGKFHTTCVCVCEHRQYREVWLGGAHGAAVRCRRGAALSLSTSPFLPCEASFHPEVG